MKMLHAMRDEVVAHQGRCGPGFDGRIGDRCGVVDDHGEEIFADRGRRDAGADMSTLHPNSTFVGDVKSTGLYGLSRSGAAEEGVRPTTGRPATPT